MGLETLAGCQALKERLLPRLERGELSHAYIISGPVGSGRHTLARLLASAMVCTGPKPGPCGLCSACRKAAAGIHPDISQIAGEDGKPVTVDQVRALRSDAFIRPNEAARKVCILEGADTMNSSAQNAMLKLLEEGPAYAAFLLLAEDAAGLLSTVRSRCEELAMPPVPVPQAELWLSRRFPRKTPQEIRQAALDCQGVLGRAEALLQGGGEDEELTDRVRRLTEAILERDEAGLMELCLSLEKWDRQRFTALLERLNGELVRCLAGSAERRRLLAEIGLLDELRRAVAVNVGAGHLAGWLCAGSAALFQ